MKTRAQVVIEMQLLANVIATRGPTAPGAILWCGQSPDNPAQLAIELTPESFADFAEREWAPADRDGSCSHTDEDGILWCCSVDCTGRGNDRNWTAT